MFLSANELETKFLNALEIEKYSTDKAYEIYTELAEMGLPSAQMKIILYHLNPRSSKFDFVKKQPEKAKRWLNKELKANNPDAYYKKAILISLEGSRYQWGTPEKKLMINNILKL